MLNSLFFYSTESPSLPIGHPLPQPFLIFPQTRHPKPALPKPSGIPSPDFPYMPLPVNRLSKLNWLYWFAYLTK